MAYVKTYKFKNEKTECSIRVNVNTDTGEFSCKLPEFAKPYTYVERTTELGQKRLDVRRGDWCVVAKTLNELKAYLDHLWTYQSPKTKSYPVIHYLINSNIKYCTDNNGNVYPNGHDVENYKFYGLDYPENGYSIGIYAKALLRTDEYLVDERSSSSSSSSSNGNEKIISTKYELYYDEENNGSHLNKKTAAARLNSWCNMDLDSELKRKVVEIPYTPETADFFYQSIFNLVQQAIKIEQFFGNKDVIEKLKLGQIAHQNLLGFSE